MKRFRSLVLEAGAVRLTIWSHRSSLNASFVYESHVIENGCVIQIRVIVV
jgi:hypothetical protein